MKELHAVSAAQQGRQTEPSVKTLRPTPILLEALRAEWQNSVPCFARHQSEEIKI